MPILIPDLRSVLGVLLSRRLVGVSVSKPLTRSGGTSTSTYPEHQQVQIEKHGQHIRVWPVRKRVRDGRLNKKTDIADYLLVLQPLDTYP